MRYVYRPTRSERSPFQASWISWEQAADGTSHRVACVAVRTCDHPVRTSQAPYLWSFDNEIGPQRHYVPSRTSFRNMTICRSFSIGETGFEPATARPPAGCATRLRHSPWLSKRATGIEPALEAWKASVQPQHFARSPRPILLARLARHTQPAPPARPDGDGRSDLSPPRARPAPSGAPRLAPRRTRPPDPAAATGRTSYRARRPA
jgi:hypothetical protein